jgi:hypothetical protein
MNRIYSILVLLPALLLTMSVAPTGAAAETVTFQVKSMSQDKVQIQFFSQDRRHRWPSVDRAYNLNDYDEHDFKLSCIRDERICYGAWVTGNSGRYWGVGSEGKSSCERCCYKCRGGETRHIVLRSTVRR